MDESQTAASSRGRSDTGGTPGPVGADARPDDVPHCPLCEYDLRGLVEARCPECGHRFTWAELTDPDKKLHPYLFEHHPRRNVASFVRTLLGGLPPRRFWATLRPTQPSHPGRLVLYWALANLLLPVAFVVLFLSTVLTEVPDQIRRRAAHLEDYRWLVSAEGQRRNPYGTDVVNRNVSAQQYVDFEAAPPLSVGFLRQVYYRRFHRVAADAVAATVAYLLWPWITFATLMIFQASMRRARVKRTHVLRCALYACDAGLWVGVLVAVLVPPTLARLDREFPLPGRFVMAAALVFAAFTAWRLAAAYRFYLRFDHPAATAVASQLIAALLAIAHTHAVHLA